MKVLQSIGAIVLFLSALAVNAQTTVNVGSGQEKPDAAGVYTETWMKHLNCAAYQPSGASVYYKVRSNRPDLFFEEGSLLRACLMEVKTSIENPSKNKQKVKVLFSYMQQMVNLPPFTVVAVTPAVNCLVVQNEKQQEMSYEFTFPYFGEDELANFTHESILRTCIHQSKPISRNTQDNKDNGI